MRKILIFEPSLLGEFKFQEYGLRDTHGPTFHDLSISVVFEGIPTGNEKVVREKPRKVENMGAPHMTIGCKTKMPEGSTGIFFLLGSDLAAESQLCHHLPYAYI